MKPSVSICIPAYRQPKLLKRTLESIFAQHFADFEIIVTDDSDTDELEGVVSRWRDDARLIYCRNKVRLGSPENWNAAMAMARGEFIKFMHHDDWFSSPTSLAQFVAAVTSNPNVDFAFSAANACENDGSLIFVHRPSPSQIELLKTRPLCLQFGNFIGAPSATIFRRQANFRFDTRLRWVVDVKAYLQLLGPVPRFEFIPEALVCISSNGAHQVTRSVASDPVSRISEHLHLYSDFAPKDVYDRLDGTRFLLSLLTGSTFRDLQSLSAKRAQERRTIEEGTAVLVAKGRALLAAFVYRAKQLFAKASSAEEAGRLSFAQSGEDMIVDFLFMWLGIGDITYLDIGANHPTSLSNTYHFYCKGSRGVLIEPDEDLCRGLRVARPADRVLNLAVGTIGDDFMTMYVMTSRTLNTLDREQAEALEEGGRERIEAIRQVRRMGINEILVAHFSDGKPNFVSLDIEGLDYDILAAWDFSRFRPEVFCVETLTYSQSNTERKLSEIIELMASKHYRVYADTYVNTIFVCEHAWANRPVFA